MTIKGILFDLYGTLVNIETDEGMEEVYRTLSHFLTYHGIDMHRWQVRDLYFNILNGRKDRNPEKYPEIDVETIWREFLRQKGVRPESVRKSLALSLARLFRAISRKRLELYPDVPPVLDRLGELYPLGLVSDAQPCFAVPEMRAMGLSGRFRPVVFSAPLGFRKPDPRMFLAAAEAMGVRPGETLYVGNDMYRDMCGAKRAGMKTLFFSSNQGEKTYKDTSPDYVVTRFADVPTGVEFLAKG